MEVTSSAAGSFDAGHVIEALPRCSSPNHGHSWTVTVTIGGELDPKTGWVRGADTLPESLEGFLRELRGRDLNEMLPGTVTSPLGIASVTIDRLALRYPRIVRCEVECSDGTRGGITRTPRQL